MSVADRERALHGRRVAIAAGGTAGHVYPALAVADVYRRLVPGATVVFLGTASGLEARLVPAHGYRLAVVSAAPFVGVGLASKARAMTALAAGALEARRVLGAARVDVLLGFGNYAAAGALLGAWTLGLPTVLHEANAVAGLANRLLGRLADRVLLGFETAGPAFAPDKVAVTGTPVREEILRLGAAPPRRPGGAFRVLVSGGSQGSPFLDERVPLLLGAVAARGHTVEARHAVGDGDAARTRAAYAQAGVVATVTSYVDDMAAAYAWADFAVVCAGAVTLAELAAVGLPALVVPLSGAALDHQCANARAFADATGAAWTREEAWDTEALAATVVALRASPAGWSAASAGVRRSARPAASEAVVEACEAMLGCVRTATGAA